MKKKITLFLNLFFCITSLIAQVTLNADGAGNTYELITSVLAPGYNPIEVPDCNHSAFGRHIDEVFDANLNTNVFRFSMHATPDNDRCNGSIDRQRNEIKTYNQSPDNLLGVEDEIVQYKWKFKLDAGFQSSSSFTHIHQLKSVGGSLASMPMYTLTTRKGNPDQLELRYAETTSQITSKKTDLTPFKGVWVEVTETIKYSTAGSYSIEIKKISDDTVLFEYTNSSIINWRPGGDFVRPKWGIYRSLNSASDLRDEQVLFANFSIEELNSLSINDDKNDNDLVKIVPNPSNNIITFIEKYPKSFDSIDIYDARGKLILKNEKTQNNTLNISNLASGLYLLVLKQGLTRIAEHKLIVK